MITNDSVLSPQSSAGRKKKTAGRESLCSTQAVIQLQSALCSSHSLLPCMYPPIRSFSTSVGIRVSLMKYI